jgi:helix-turn-helix protein
MPPKKQQQEEDIEFGLDADQVKAYREAEKARIVARKFFNTDSPDVQQIQFALTNILEISYDDEDDEDDKDEAE